MALGANTHLTPARHTPKPGTASPVATRPAKIALAPATPAGIFGLGIVLMRLRRRAEPARAAHPKRFAIACENAHVDRPVGWIDAPGPVRRSSRPNRPREEAGRWFYRHAGESLAANATLRLGRSVDGPCDERVRRAIGETAYLRRGAEGTVTRLRQGSAPITTRNPSHDPTPHAPCRPLTCLHQTLRRSQSIAAGSGVRQRSGSRRRSPA